MRVAGGNDQTALAGDELPAPVEVRVVDRYDNPVPGQVVRFSPVDGGGTVTPDVATTESDGIARGVRWRLGPLTSLQSVRASTGAFAIAVVARVRSDFAIDVRFAGVEPSPEFQSAFRRAADRIRTAVIGDLPDVAVQGLNVSTCGNGVTGTLTETIDDIIIFASVVPIDGVGKVLARAGPCFIRNTSLQSLVGTMQFDEADAQGLLSSGRFEAVVLHEMLHIVGIGSLWRLRNLVDSLGTTDPRYIGAVGVSRCALVGFGAQCTTGVPVENTGGSGTAGVHWRESVFDRELMTGFAESTPDMPFSVLSIGSLVDYGYEVNEKGSDPFEFTALLGGSRVRARQATPGGAPWEEVLAPRFEVSPFGFVQPVRTSPSHHPEMNEAPHRRPVRSTSTRLLHYSAVAPAAAATFELRRVLVAPFDGSCTSAISSTSASDSTGWKVSSLRTSSGTSSMSAAFWRGMMMCLIPARCAPSTFSLSPPIGSARPRSVISPVIATSRRTGRPDSSDTSAVAIARPADGPSFGIAPAGTWMCASRALVTRSGGMPSCRALLVA